MGKRVLSRCFKKVPKNDNLRWSGIMIQMPEIATPQQVAEYLQISVRTVHNMTGRREWRDGIYIGRARYNMDKLRSMTTPPYQYAIDVHDLSTFCNDQKRFVSSCTGETEPQPQRLELQSSQHWKLALP